MKRALIIAASLALAACEAQVERGDARARAGSVGAHALAPEILPAFFDCLRERGQAVVSAHRGGPAPGFAENAISTFGNTLRQAPAFLEVDIARAADGALVLMHDETLDRTTTGAGAVRDHTLAQIKALRLRDGSGRALGEGPPTLREALDWAAGRAILELDAKRGVSYEVVAREVRNAGAMERVVFITYSVDGAARLARAAPEAMIYTTITSAAELDLLARRGVDLARIVAWIGTGEADGALIEALHVRGVEARLGVFGQRRAGAFSQAAAAGVSIIAADDAREAVRALDEADGEEGYAALACVGAN